MYQAELLLSSFVAPAGRQAGRTLVRLVILFSYIKQSFLIRNISLGEIKIFFDQLYKTNQDRQHFFTSQSIEFTTIHNHSQYDQRRN